MSAPPPPAVALSLGILGAAAAFLLPPRLSGWSRLAECYREERPFQGPKRRFQTLWLRWLTHYGNCATVGADGFGLHLSMFFLLRLGHPPLFIPWSEIEVREGRRSVLMPFATMELSFRQVPGVSVRMREELALLLKENAGPSWPESKKSA